MNACKHEHLCFEHFAHRGEKIVKYSCWNPECMNLPGVQGLCLKCSFFHGWAQAVDRTRLEDWNW